MQPDAITLKKKEKVRTRKYDHIFLSRQLTERDVRATDKSEGVMFRPHSSRDDGDDDVRRRQRPERNDDSDGHRRSRRGHDDDDDDGNGRRRYRHGRNDGDGNGRRCQRHERDEDHDSKEEDGDRCRPHRS